MKPNLLLVLMVAIATLGFVGCEFDEGSDGDSSTTTQPDVTNDESETAVGMEYRYVRVDDMSGIITGQDPGADIDAIILEKAAGTDVYADKIEAFQLGVDVGDNIDPVDALGAPDSVVDFKGSAPPATPMRVSCLLVAPVTSSLTWVKPSKLATRSPSSRSVAAITAVAWPSSRWSKCKFRSRPSPRTNTGSLSARAKALT